MFSVLQGKKFFLRDQGMEGHCFPLGRGWRSLGCGWKESGLHARSLWSLQRPETPHPLLPAQPLFLQRPQQHVLVQQQQQPLGQPQLLPQSESQPQPQPEPEQDPL